MSTQWVIGVFEGDDTADPEEYFFGRPSTVRPPKLFRESGLDLGGSTVREINFHMGTYGMGGPGFLGFLLEEPASRMRRWLVITLWAAAGWATLDGALIAEELTSPDDRAAASAAGYDIRELTPSVLDATLTAATCADDVLTLEFDLVGTVHRLQIRADGRDVLPWQGSGKRRRLSPGESLRDAVVVSESGYLWTEDDEEDDS